MVLQHGPSKNHLTNKHASNETDVVPYFSNVQSQKPNHISSLATTLATHLATAMALPSGKLEQKTSSHKHDVSMPCQTEMEINDLFQRARWKVTQRQTLRDIADKTGAIVVVRGKYFGPCDVIRKGEKKLHLLLEGPTEDSLFAATKKIRQIIEDQTNLVLAKVPGK